MESPRVIDFGNFEQGDKAFATSRIYTKMLDERTSVTEKVLIGLGRIPQDFFLLDSGMSP
jgi:hypothetical protein